MRMEKWPLSFDHFRDVALCLVDWYIVFSQPQDNWCKLPVAGTETPRGYGRICSMRDDESESRHVTADRETRRAQG